MKIFTSIFLCVISACFGKTIESDDFIRTFPDQFFFGASTAAYQIEGAWNTSGKGESIWDDLTHKHPEMIISRQNGDVACDSYNLYEQDVEMLSELGVDYYRFSISWPRILPSGFSDSINQGGIDYYNKLIDALLEKNIIPFVTLYHWDLPQKLQILGGWTNPLMAEYFEDFAKVAYEKFGDRVKHWITFNEPDNTCVDGYGGKNAAPAVNSPGIAEYMCAHTILQAHARAYHLYDKNYRDAQKGSIGITLVTPWLEPATATKPDEEAAERAFQFHLGWFANPIFSKEGDYPTVMKERIASNSEKQGFLRSRLPVFSSDEILAIKGTADFLGLNHYTTKMVKHIDDRPAMTQPSFADDMNVEEYAEKSWPGSASDWLKVVPWGFRKALNKIRLEYDNTEVIITENGFSSKGGLDDSDRVFYLNQYLNALLDAIDDGCNVSAYTVWSLMDNFEWLRGYTERFGLYEVNFQDRKKRRTARESAKYFSNIIKTRSLKYVDTCNGCPEDAMAVNFNAIIV